MNVNVRIPEIPLLPAWVTPQRAKYFFAFAVGLNVGTGIQYLVVKSASKKMIEYNEWSDSAKADLMDRMMKLISELGDNEAVATMITDVQIFARLMEEKHREIHGF